MRRKIIMHVGPTNSGKTHHALRALAAAKVGVYAGPLRLLAHEIWERLNLGQIVPAGATDEQIAEAAKFGSSTDSPFARPTNMITGEEQKIVLPPNTNGLISCTVEMLHIHSQYDVAVIDEIQMISDRERGQGWLRAVMGLCAREVHLCGEETAVPLIEELLKATGDEIVVKRYDRLTPLVVEETSLESDLSRVRKGDCIVAFSRTAIFALKRQIEKLTDIKCAVVYGKLPPEIRSEQAALFNDPDSGYDVLIGSDAIGMGLNLKIRRIIFEAIHKYDGKSMSLLSLSQMKQIAGRAGRFGMQDVNEKPGGFVTTLSAEDLPVLRETLLIGTPSLAYARLALTREDFQRIAAHLPPNASTETMYLAHMHAGRLPSCYRNSVPNMLKAICEYLDNQGYFTLADRVLFMQAPFPWRDRVALEAITRFITAYYQSMHVPLIETMNNLPYLRTLEEAEEAMDSKDGHKAGGRSFSAAQQLEGLEIFHKILVVYLWLSYRNPVSYPSYDLTLDWKERLERVLHWCLQEMTQYRGLRPEAVKPNRVPIEWKSKRQLALEVQTELRLQNEAEPNLPKKSKRQLAAEFAERFSVDGSPAPP
ncbi:P-loop containing nucleoside triphosphate hydrolase protein [Mycena epipterygia]|nr:P-loop containing nucleoside triphosphate hydrolase protein [Mycena epipterygia]